MSNTEENVKFIDIDRLCVRVLKNRNRFMITDEEFNEMDALRKEITYNPSAVHPQQMERFTELFVRSLEGKGDPVTVGKVAHNAL